MTVIGSGTVTICRGPGLAKGLFLRADDAGLLVRNFPLGRARRIAWTEISHFADGRYKDKGVTWRLVIILRTGKQVRVLCSVMQPTGEVVAAAGRQPSPTGYPPSWPGFR